MQVQKNKNKNTEQHQLPTQKHMQVVYICDKCVVCVCVSKKTPKNKWIPSNPHQVEWFNKNNMIMVILQRLQSESI